MTTAGEHANIHLQEPAIEEVEYESLFLFRLPLEDARRRLPSHLEPVVIAPETSLFGIGVQCISRTRFCPVTDILKIYLIHGVEPRYDLGTATPRFGFYVPTIYVEPPAFRNEIRRIDRVEPHEGTRLQFTFDSTKSEVSAHDDAGPIFTLRRTTPPPVYRRLSMWNQARSMYEGKPYVQAVQWEGEAFEHSGTADVGVVHPHPIFGGLPVEELGARGYHQLLMRPGSRGTVTLYRPVPEAPLARGDR